MYLIQIVYKGPSPFPLFVFDEVTKRENNIVQTIYFHREIQHNDHIVRDILIIRRLIGFGVDYKVELSSS